MSAAFYPASMPARRPSPSNPDPTPAVRRPPRAPRSVSTHRGDRAPATDRHEPTSAIPPATKEQLILTAERLFAVHGIDAVSLRQISVEAGNANNSAVQYHFGSKEGLVRAIFEYRIPHLTRRRRLLVAEATSRGAENDLRTCIECYLLPVVEEAEADDGYYLMFLAQLQRYGIGETPFDRLPEMLRATTRGFMTRVADLLVDIPEPVRSNRVAGAMTICLHASADRQRSRRHGAPVLPYALHVANLFDGLMGFLQAPVSEATARALAATSARRATERTPAAKAGSHRPTDQQEVRG
jgi:AcrR family transcriptional regulator